jgi:putative colanic acid biosynthesis acetyltransferase WcaF
MIAVVQNDPTRDQEAELKQHRRDGFADVPTEKPSMLRVCLAEFDNRSFSRGRSVLVEALWLVVQTLLVSSSLPGSAHRRILLRLFGARIGSGVRIKPRLRVKFPWRLTIDTNAWLGEGVWIDNLAEVEIGANCCISQEAFLCTGSHDWSKPSFDLVTNSIRIGEGAWIAAKSVVAPGVTIGRGAVLTLASVATGNLEEWTVYQGNPAKILGKRRLIVPNKG